MPAIVTCSGNIFEKRWNVGADDLVLPAFVAVVFGLFNFVLILAVLFALFYIPSPSKFELPPCYNVTYPPVLYAPLFSLVFIEVAFILTEGMFIVIGAHGPILNNAPSSVRREKIMPWIIYMRGIVGFLEIVAIVACLVGLHLPVVNAFQKECEELAPRLRFARGVVFFQVALYMLFLLKICLYSDPLGISTPGLLEKLRMLDDTDSRGSLLEDSTTVEMTPGGQLDNLFLPQATNEPLKLTNEVNIWTKQRRSVFRLNENDIENVTKIHNDHVSRKNYERRLKAIFCCLGIQGHKSRGAALEDVARGLYTVFSETDVVLSDIIAGFALLKKYQHKVKKRKGEAGLTNKFRMVTFKMMPLHQRYGLPPNIIRQDYHFNLNSVSNQQLLLDLTHYMHYAMGIYGWPLHVFDNLACGFCQLCSVSCCRFRCTHKRVKDDEMLNDNFCMCGVGTFRLQTGLREEDILYVNFENKIYLAPFIVCLDHQMKSVVVCVRGTLSFKDTLTDMSFSPIFRKVSGVKETYIHGGMYRAAVGIMNVLRKKQLLVNSFLKYPGYQLVVTGHSLGAGVASIVALLLKQKLKLSDDLIKCYAFSPPGALFSFPLAEYSKSFITTVVLGNDIVARITLRGLLFLKLSIQEQLKKSQLPKYRILLCKKRQRCFNLFCCCRKRKKEDEEDPAPVPQERYRRTGDDSLPTPSLAEEEGGEGLDQFDDCVVADGPGDGAQGGVALEEEEEGEGESLEWQVMNSHTTTASIRRKLFQRSISIHPDKHSEQSRRGFTRFNTSVNFRSQKSVATESFAQKMKKAISLDFDGDVIPDGFIQGADETDGLEAFGGFGAFSGGDGSSQHRHDMHRDVTFSETPQPLEREHAFVEADGGGRRTSSSPLTADRDDVFEPEEDALPTEEERPVSEPSSESHHLQGHREIGERFEEGVSSCSMDNSLDLSDNASLSFSRKPITLQAELHPSADDITSSPNLSGPRQSNQSLTTLPPSSYPEASPPTSQAALPQLASLAEESSLHSGADSLNRMVSDVSSASSDTSFSRKREIKLVPLQSCSSVKESYKRRMEEALDFRGRSSSDNTPGEALKTTVPKMLEHCYADEGKLFMPFFLPGRVLHIQVEKSKQWCGNDELLMMDTYRENMCVILLDNGMVDDHLPNNVLSALKAFKAECGISFKLDEINEERNRQEKFRARVRGVDEQSKVNKKQGFIFMAPGSPSSSSASGSTSTTETSRRRTQLKKQRSFDRSGLHPPLAGKNSLNIVERSSVGLQQISECTEEDPGSARTLPSADKDLNEVVQQHHQGEAFTSNVSSDCVGNLTAQRSSNGTGTDFVDTGPGPGPSPSPSPGPSPGDTRIARTGSKLTLLERRQGPSGRLKLNLSGESNHSQDT